jgi:hypothetical protein
MAYTYTEMFIRSPVVRSQEPAGAERSPGFDARQAAKTGRTFTSAAAKPPNDQDKLREHLSEKSADGWRIDQYFVTARDDGFTHHIIWHKADR